MPGARLFRGFLLEATTFGTTKSLVIRDADTGATHDFTGGPATNNISHSTQSQVEYAFTTPFIAHLVREEPLDAVPWEKFGIVWISDPVPEFTIEDTAWTNCGTPGAKYMLDVVIPLDTGGAPVPLLFVSTDGTTFLSPPITTTAAYKTPVAIAFTTPFVVHELRIQPSTPCRIWLDEAKWSFDPWPELLAEQTPWTDLGQRGSKYTRGLVLPLDTNGAPVEFNLITSDGTSIILGPFTTTRSVKTPVPIPFVTPLLIQEAAIQANGPCRTWWAEARWDCDLWPERITEASPWLDMGRRGAKYVRGVKVPLETGGNAENFSIISSDGTPPLVCAASTAVNVKTVQVFVFEPPQVVHEVQFVPPPGNGLRLWWQEAEWDADPWPELAAEQTSWTDMGAKGVKYVRGLVLPVETGGRSGALTLLTSDGPTVPLTPVTTVTNIKTSLPFAFAVPLLVHEAVIRPEFPCRIWWDEARWDADPWPELIDEATGWLPVLGGQSAFLQGLVVPVEAAGAVPQFSLLTDAGVTIPLVSPIVPVANVKTSIPLSLATPVVCHQAQLIPSTPCRVWVPELRWVAQPTPEVAAAWITQFTSHGMPGYQSIPRMEVAYSSTAPVTLTLSTFGGPGPLPIVLPSTGGIMQKLLVTFTPNKFLLVQYAAVSAAIFQIFASDSTVWVEACGRSGPAQVIKALGDVQGAEARI